MSYLSFLVIFVIIPGFVFSYLAWKRAKKTGLQRRLKWHALGTLILAAIAFTWTTPWDNYIVAKGVWTYGEDRVIGVIGYVPIEEYAFFILMPFLNSALFAYLFLAQARGQSHFQTKQTFLRSVTFGFGLTLFVLGWLLIQREPFTYLASTLIWFIPPLLIQWIFDPTLLLARIRLLSVSTFVPAIYLSVADAWAISNGIWTIEDPTRTGWQLGNLPFEEAFFFFITSLLLAQGLLLWHSLMHE
ncbi:MAG: lycopene cyclase domain-containing protein [Verrucomicrobiota bacterium]